MGINDKKHPHEITLEQLTKHLRKVVTNPYDVPYLEELIKRVETSYLETLDVTHTKVSKTLPWGWRVISELQHVRENSTAILYFPYSTTDEWACFSSLKHERSAIPPNHLMYNAQGGYEVLAYRSFDGNWYAGAQHHSVTIERSILLDVTKATKFALFGNSYSNLLRESIIADNKSLRKQVTELKEIAERKNLELDALAMVWCTGNCNGGQFNFVEPQEITEEMLHMVACVAARLISRGPNTKQFAEKMEWYIKNFERYAQRFERHDVKAFIEKSKAILNSARENAAAVIAHIKKEM